MAKNNYVSTIAIDTVHSAIHFCSMIEGQNETIKHYVKNYSGYHFDEEFFLKFKAAIAEFVANNPSRTIGKTTVILPDSAVLTDVIKVPTMRSSSQTRKTLDVSLRSIYRNYADLKFSLIPADQNRQYATFLVMAVQKRIISSIYSACAEHRLSVETLTSASGATIAAVSANNPKLKKASYLLLDIKDTYSQYIFVANGRAVGYYSLPFGLDFLKKPMVVGEDMLFDHSYAELTVINAKEKAKAKKLTMMAVTEPDDTLTELDDAETDDEMSTDSAEAEATAILEEQEGAEDASVHPKPSVKYYTRKAPRKLPKFMRREIPETEEGILYENFRIFEKWALTLIAGNEKLTELGVPKAVYVNMPEPLSYVLEAVNQDTEENALAFNHLPYDDPTLAAHIELWGGLLHKHIASCCKF